MLISAPWDYRKNKEKITLQEYDGNFQCRNDKTMKTAWDSEEEHRDNAGTSCVPRPADSCESSLRHVSVGKNCHTLLRENATVTDFNSVLGHRPGTE